MDGLLGRDVAEDPLRADGSTARWIAENSSGEISVNGIPDRT
jgi:hypothetical protein